MPIIEVIFIDSSHYLPNVALSIKKIPTHSLVVMLGVQKHEHYSQRKPQFEITNQIVIIRITLSKSFVKSRGRMSVIIFMAGGEWVRNSGDLGKFPLLKGGLEVLA